MLRPAGSVCLYLPNRSTMPARACGTIRTVLASSTMTNSSTSASSTRKTVIGTSSGVESRDGVDVGGGAADLEHLDGLAGGDGQRLVVGGRGPLLAGELDPAVLERGDLLGDQSLLPDELAVAEPELGAG